MVQSKSVVNPSSTSVSVDKPKRPLSAYNLFFRFKRAKILEAQKAGDDSIETINRLITSTPGLEDHPSIVVDPPIVTREAIHEISRNAIRSALVDNLCPKDTRNRVHRKSGQGVGLTFLEMNKIMVASWKGIEDDIRSVFEELAEEGRKMYKTRMAEYERGGGGKVIRSSLKVKEAKGTSTSARKAAATPSKKKKVQAKKIHVVKKQKSPTAKFVSRSTNSSAPALVSPEKNDKIQVKSAKKHTTVEYPKQPTEDNRATTHSNLASLYFDDLDLDLDEEERHDGPAEPLLSSLDDIFEQGDGSNHSSSSMDCSVHSPSNVCELDDFPNLPFLPVPEGDYDNLATEYEYATPV